MRYCDGISRAYRGGLGLRSGDTSPRPPTNSSQTCLQSARKQNGIAKRLEAASWSILCEDELSVHNRSPGHMPDTAHSQPIVAA